MYTLENQNPVCERNMGSSGAPSPSTYLYTLHQGEDLMPINVMFWLSCTPFNFNIIQITFCKIRQNFSVKGFFFYWPLGGGAPRAATQYLDTLGLDKYTRSLNGSTSLRIHIKSTNKHWLWDEIQYFLSFNHSAGSPCPGWRRSTPPWWPFGWDSTTQAVPMAQELSCLVSSHSRFI